MRTFQMATVGEDHGWNWSDTLITLGLIVFLIVVVGVCLVGVLSVLDLYHRGRPGGRR